MENNIYITDNDLKDLFKNRIIQFDNYNSYSELFIHNNEIIKIYNEKNNYSEFNINVVKNILNKKSFLKEINGLVLPNNLLIYNNQIVGFSMPYINGITFQDIINNNIYDDETIKKLFIKVLDIIDRFKKLNFSFYIGDLHEQNIIIDNNKNVNIIDPDSFIIDNNKLCIDGNYIIGRYANSYFNNSELKEINNSVDYYSLLCMILNYVFKDILEDKLDPVNWLKYDDQFKELYPIINRVNNIFILYKDDINNIFNFKKNFIYKKKDNKLLLKEINRIRSI